MPPFDFRVTIRRTGADFAPLAPYSPARRVSGQPRVFRPQSGLTHSRSTGIRCAAFFSSADPLHARHVWRVNIISRPDLIGVLERFERLQQLHIGPRGFNGDHVSVQRGNGVHDVIELAIAHVSMDLRVVFGDRSIKAEGFHPTADRHPSRCASAVTLRAAPAHQSG